MKIALLAGAAALAGLSSPAPAQGGPPNPNCNACFDAIRTDVAAVGQQVSGVQAAVGQTQQSLTQVQQGVAGVGQQATGLQTAIGQSQQSLTEVQQAVSGVRGQVTGVDNRLLGVASQVGGVLARTQHIHELANQTHTAVAQANQKLDTLVAALPPTPTPAPAFKKSAVVIEFGTPNPKPANGDTGAGVTDPVRADRASTTYCQGINYAAGKALDYIVAAPNLGPRISHVSRLVCYD